MSEQITLFEIPKRKHTVQDKRRWENAFQKWSNEQSEDGMTALGICGYGNICDWCEDNSYGRPCVRALNKMCREKHITIDYTDYDFERFW